MKLAHIADLHIGRRFEDLSLFEDQIDILESILNLITDEAIDVLLIAGDVYDKVSPSSESFMVWNGFLERLAALDVDVVVISGNHDSQNRLGVGARLLTSHRIHIITDLQDAIKPIILNDNYGPLNFYPIPFIKPIDVRNAFPEFIGTSYDEAFKFLVKKIVLNAQQRNVVLAHQFFVNGTNIPDLSDSEMPNVGGLDAIDITHLDDFDYVALGHIHKPQRVKSEHMRYSGSPLKYSFSETHHQKSIPLITLKEKGNLQIEFRNLSFYRDVKVITGPIEELMSAGKSAPTQDFVKAIITDEYEVYDAYGKLIQIYPNLVNLEVRNQSRENNIELLRADEIIQKSHLERFNDLFEYQQNRSLTEPEIALLNQIILEVEDDEAH